MKLANRWLLIAVLALLLGAAAAWVLIQRKAAGGTPAPAKLAASAGPQAIELTPGDLATASVTEIASLLEVTGSVKAYNSALVKTRIAAELKTLSVREGEAVRAGQLIGQLDTTEFDLRLRQAEDQAAAAQAQLDIAQRTLDNNKALVTQGFISRNALDTSISSAASASASLQAARAAADLARKAVRDGEIRAPISGMISQRLAQAGERLGVDARVVEIVDLSRVELEAAVAPEDVVKLRVGQRAQVQIDGLAQSVAATVARINPSAQTGTRSVSAYLALQAAPGLRQGLFGRAGIEVTRKLALVVPLSALRLEQSQPYVLVFEGGKATQRRVSTGLRGEVPGAGGSEAVVEVLEGLKAGDQVLRSSVGALREGTLLKLAAGVAAGVSGAVTGAVAGAVAPGPASAASAGQSTAAAAAAAVASAPSK